MQPTLLSEPKDIGMIMHTKGGFICRFLASDEPKDPASFKYKSSFDRSQNFKNKSTSITM